VIVLTYKTSTKRYAERFSAITNCYMRYCCTQVKLQSGGAVLSGSIAVCGHYFENGNMQLRSQRSVPLVELPLPAGSDLPTAVAAAIVAAVRSAEDSLQAALEEMYASMSESTLRSMRRAVPVNAERFSWQIAQIRMRNTLIASRK
jgi:F-actin capping protein alpha subunit